MKIKTAYLKAPWQVELRAVEIADVPPPGWVRLRVEACGICGTDLSAAAAHAREWQAFGHEIAGVVEAVGAGLPHVQPGQRMVLESASFCGRCATCRNGRPDLCQGGAPNFWGQAAMGFSEQMLAPGACLVPYEGLTPAEACLAEPAGVAYDMVKTAGIAMGDRVCVVGPGPIALAGIALAARQTPSRLLCIGHAHSTARLKLAAALGAEVCATTAPLDTLADLRGQFDHVLMTAPVEHLAPGLALLAYGGIMTYIGIGTGESRISFDANDFHFRKLQLRASFASPAMYFPATLALMRNGTIPARRLISHTFPLTRIADALRVCREDKATAIKVIVTPT